jgi:serine/threonine-protein phosphatase 5
MPPSETDFDEEEIKKAEEFKTQGNDFFKKNEFEQALDRYSEAIFCNVPLKKKAVYYCNRALVSLKTENYALALFDAKDAIKCDETYAKAYYRQGSAHLALNQHELAVQDFKKVCKLDPKNKDARDKYE